MALPQIQISGNLTADPELRFTQAGTPVASLRIAASERIKDKDTNEWKDGDACFLSVTVWRNAEAMAERLHKGSAVLISGTLKQRTYQAADGTDRTTYEVNATDVAELIRGTGNSAAAKPAADDPWATTPATTWNDTQDQPPF